MYISPKGEYLLHTSWRTQRLFYDFVFCYFKYVSTRYNTVNKLNIHSVDTAICIYCRLSVNLIYFMHSQLIYSEDRVTQFYDFAYKKVLAFNLSCITN